MVGVADFAELFIAYLSSLFELAYNSANLLLNDSLQPKVIWNVTYHAGSFAYWFAKPFIGEGAALYAATNNSYALANLTDAFSYLGSSEVVGNESRGVIGMLTQARSMVNEDLAVKLWVATKKLSELAVKMLGNVSGL